MAMKGDAQPSVGGETPRSDSAATRREELLKNRKLRDVYGLGSC